MFLPGSTQERDVSPSWQPILPAKQAPWSASGLLGDISGLGCDQRNVKDPSTNSSLGFPEIRYLMFILIACNAEIKHTLGMKRGPRQMRPGALSLPFACMVFLLLYCDLCFRKALDECALWSLVSPSSYKTLCNCWNGKVKENLRTLSSPKDNQTPRMILNWILPLYRTLLGGRGLARIKWQSHVCWHECSGCGGYVVVKREKVLGRRKFIKALEGTTLSQTVQKKSSFSDNIALMALESIALNEMGRIEKGKYRMISRTCGI